MPFVRRKSSIVPTQDAPTSQLGKTRPARAVAGRSSKHLVHPKAAPDLTTSENTAFRSRSKLLVGLYHWATCAFIFGLVFSQLLGAVRDTTTTEQHIVYGRSPLLGPSQIVGSNDVPYADRVIACVGRGQLYKPRLVSSLLARPGETAILEDSTGTAVHGYRLKQRRPGSVIDSLDSAAQLSYKTSCDFIAKTIDSILKACLALGYTNLTLDNLRVVDDWDSKDLYELPNTLSILILPYWDNAPYARHAVPTWGGDACVFRLEDAYAGTSGTSGFATFRGVNQSVRHERTTRWLDRPGGYWKNGWYEDKEGMRWYSDVTSSAKGAPYNMMHRVFDMMKGEERDCSDPNDCEVAANFERWGDKFSSGSRGHNLNSVYIANATEFGLFMYESFPLRIVRSVFDWETLLSNLCTWWILHRWALAQVLMLASAIRGRNDWGGVGISSVSSSRSFVLLPLMCLPRLSMTLAAFWTVGCAFEGQQSALADAWFAIYAAIAQLVLIYFSLLNLLGKILRRRVSDVLFTPTVVALCLLHYFRLRLADSGWLKGVDGRVGTVIFSDEVKQLQLLDYLTTDTAWRMNGRVALVFYAKLCILAVNLIPLLLARPLPSRRRGANLGLNGIEKAISLRSSGVGGLGNAPPYIIAMIDARSKQLLSSKVCAPQSRYGCCSKHKVRTSDISQTEENSESSMVTPVRKIIDQTDNDFKQHDVRRQVNLVSSLELIRLGYLVFGDSYVITFQEYGRICAMAPLRAFFHLWNHRVLVWTLRPVDDSGDAEIAGGRVLESMEPQMWRLDDPRLKNIRWWQVSTCSIQC